MGKITDLLGEKKHSKNEENIDQIIKDLISQKASDDNKEQGQTVQLLKGLAFSDDPKSGAFMKKLTDLINDKNFGSLVEEESSLVNEKAHHLSIIADQLHKGKKSSGIF